LGPYYLHLTSPPITIRSSALTNTPLYLSFGPLLYTMGSLALGFLRRTPKHDLQRKQGSANAP
jgi:hypothetical protein